ncbi:MAG: TraB/GumN family protein [Pseudomonadota bacterium]
MIRWLLVALLLASPVAGANWATKGVCTVDELTVPEGLFSDAELASMKARAAEIPNSVGRLWRIEASSGAVSHLFGTMHTNATILLDVPPELEAILAETRVIAPEIDHRLRARRFARNDPQDSLRWSTSRRGANNSPFEPELEDWVRTLFSGYGLEQPWQIMTDAALAEILLWDPCNDFNSGVFPVMDNLIMLEAALAGAEVLPLEGQGYFMTELSRRQWEDALHGVLQVYGAAAEPALSNKERQAAFALYAEGRLGELTAWSDAALSEVFGAQRAARYGADADAFLLTERNERWLDLIEGDLQIGGVTMSVGAAHLAGEEGLIEMLRARGFSVTRIVATGEVLR